MSNQPHLTQPQGSPFLKKLGTYLFGVAIGFLILGWFQYKKSTATQQQRQQLQDQGIAPPADAANSTEQSP